jgi:plastocyanin
MDDAGRARGRRWWLVVAAFMAATLVTGAAACGGDDDEGGSDDAQSDDATSDDAYGGGDEGDDAEGATGTADATFEVTAFEFADVTAPAGGTVEFVNSSGGEHTVTADDGDFDETLPDGETATVEVPGDPGEYAFHCEIHPSMVATLIAE